MQAVKNHVRILTSVCTHACFGSASHGTHDLPHSRQTSIELCP